MSRYGKGLIVVTALVVGRAAHSGLSDIMTVDSTKNAVPKFSDERRRFEMRS